ncbi:MAG: hypothetical protein JNK60_00630 [Acidobacteria bacterium]|nr:hypothetical protein [Acidobacteriota bacterium]
MKNRTLSALAATATAAALTLAPALLAQNDPGAAAPTGSGPKLKLSAEIKVNVRNSSDVKFRPAFPFPPDFIPAGADGVDMRTTDPGTSAEISNLALQLDAVLTPDITARARVHVLDLYNRNPTSSEDRILVREAWLRIGKKEDVFEPIQKNSFYIEAGRLPRFSKQIVRKLESYGLWGTAVSRFEENAGEAGASFGNLFYVRAAVASPNPLFFRDPNALAGDNGTPERQPGNVRPIFESGFPILYDAKAQDVNFGGKLQYGGGFGVKMVGPDGQGLDLLAWYFTRDLADSVAIRGTSYSGDIKLLNAFAGFGIAFPLDGRTKREYGINLNLKLGGLTVSGQYVMQNIAGLKRQGPEAEVSWFFPIGGLFASGDQPVFTFLEPAIRYSHIDNRFDTPRLYPAPSVGWDWTKIDIGFRLGIIRGVDLTAEYSKNDMKLFSGAKLHPNEFLLTLRAGF